MSKEMSKEERVAEVEKALKEPFKRPDTDNLRELVHPRKSGWSCPWHPFQMIAWFFIFFFTVAHYGFLVFYIPGLWRIFGYIIPGVVLLVHIVCNFTATYIDAAEENVRKKFKSGRHLRPFFNSARHKHVIENLHCNLCQVNVSAKAKHCRTCEKCVYDFDHHCLWLNNCIGRRNYRWFLGTVFSALVGAVVMLVMNLSYFILFFADRASVRYDCPHPTNVSACDPTLRVLGFAVPDPVFPTLTAILGVLALLAVGLLGHLSLFHAYLLCKGISTYDCISKVRVKEDARKERLKRLEQEGQLAVEYHGRCSCLRRKLNRVQPMDEENCKGRRDECSGRGSDDESVSLGSIHSDGMATFGRTPPPSDRSGNSPTDNRTDEQKLENVATWAYKENSNANNNAEKKEPVSILRNPTKRCKEPKMASTGALLVASTAIETVITMEEPLTDPSISFVGQAVNSVPVSTNLPMNLQPAVSAPCRVGGACASPKQTAVEIERMAYDDDADAGCLAAMMAGYDDGEYGNKHVKEISALEEEPGSTLAAMAGNWEPEETPEVKHGLLKTDLECAALPERNMTPFHGIPHHESRSSSLELEPSLEKVENISSYGSLTAHNLTSCPVPSPALDPDATGAVTVDRGTSPIQFSGNYLLQELTLQELRDLSKGILRSPSPDDEDEYAPPGPSCSAITSLPFSDRPLPPLPSIGDPMTSPATSKDEVPRCLQGNRPLPPIHVQHHEEHLDSGSTNSLPLPDPRYRRKGLLPKLGNSDLTLNKGKATGTTCTNIEKGKGKMQVNPTPEPRERGSDSRYGCVFPGYLAQSQGYMMEDMSYVHCVPTDSGDSLSPIPRPTNPIPEPKAFISPSQSFDPDSAVWWAGDASQ